MPILRMTSRNWSDHQRGQGRAEEIRGASGDAHLVPRHRFYMRAVELGNSALGPESIAANSSSTRTVGIAAAQIETLRARGCEH